MGRLSFPPKFGVGGGFSIPPLSSSLYAALFFRPQICAIKFSNFVFKQQKGLSQRQLSVNPLGGVYMCDTILFELLLRRV